MKFGLSVKLIAQGGKKGKLKIYFRLHASKGCMGLGGDQKNRGGVKMVK